MFSNRLTLAALALACIAAAGMGGYFASRQNAAPSLAAMTAPAPSAATPVQETEAVVDDTNPTPASPALSTAAPVPSTPALAKRTEPPARRPATPSSAKSVEASGTGSDAVPTADHVGPSGAAASSNPPASGPAHFGSPVDASAQTAHADDRAAQEPPRAPEPPQRTFEELVVPADSVIGLQTEASITSERARVEDRVEARVTRDVRVGDKVAIRAGSRAIGSVTQVERGGKFKQRARVGIRFHTLALADGTRVPITTETIYREGEAPGNASAAKIGGGAVGGAILGSILGGAKGAVIGATAGAGAGTAAAAAGDRRAVTLPAGQPLTARLLSPVTVEIEQDSAAIARTLGE